MKPFHYYTSESQRYVAKNDYVTYYVYSHGECIATVPGVSFKRSDYPHTAVIQKVVDTEALLEARKSAAKKAADIHEEFKNDLFEEFGVANNPKREKAYSFAWEHGHSNGYEEVYHYFSEIVDLIT